MSVFNLKNQDHNSLFIKSALKLNPVFLLFVDLQSIKILVKILYLVLIIYNIIVSLKRGKVKSQKTKDIKKIKKLKSKNEKKEGT